MFFFYYFRFIFLSLKFSLITSDSISEMRDDHHLHYYPHLCCFCYNVSTAVLFALHQVFLLILVTVCAEPFIYLLFILLLSFQINNLNAEHLGHLIFSKLRLFNLFSIFFSFWSHLLLRRFLFTSFLFLISHKIPLLGSCMPSQKPSLRRWMGQYSTALTQHVLRTLYSTCYLRWSTI